MKIFSLVLLSCAAAVAADIRVGIMGADTSHVVVFTQMFNDPARPDLALCMDVLAPEGYGEVIGGGQRIHDHEKLLRRIHAHKLPEDAFRWYLDLRRYGSVPHAGFGMGIERVVAWICGLDHVRETIPFPRMLYRLYP